MWLAVLACASPVRDFAEARAEVICRWHERCSTLDVAGFADVEACLEGLGAGVEHAAQRRELECPTFDSAAAAACLTTWSSAPCDVALDLSACDAVCQ